MARFVARNPYTTAAAIFAPFLAENDDRGYFRTALLTTPIVYAAGAAAPRLFTGARDVTIQGARTAVEAIKIMNKEVGSAANQVAKDISVQMVSKKVRNLAQERDTLLKIFNNRFTITPKLLAKAEAHEFGAQIRLAEINRLQKGELLTNAIHSARRSSLTMTELAQGGVGEEAKILTQDQMMSIVKQYGDRPEFIKTLRNRLRNIRNLDYGGTKLSWSGAPAAGTTRLIPLNFKTDNMARAAFEEQVGPEAYKFFEQAKREGLIERIVLEMERSEDVVAGKTGKILNATVLRLEGEHLKRLPIPLVDATGTVTLPSGLAKGVGDYVLGPGAKEYTLPHWMGKMLVERPDIPIEPAYTGAPSLSGEVTAHAYYHAGDPTDARRAAELASYGDQGTGELTAQARMLRGRVVKTSTLNVFQNTKGEMVPFDKLDVRARLALLEEDRNSGKFIAMASDAGVYERRYVMREAANLSPWGITSATGQDSTWRAVTKEWKIAPRPGMEIPASARPGWYSTAWKPLTGEDTLPGIRETFAMISPQDRTLFSEMPANLTVAGGQSTVEELADAAIQREDIIGRFTGRGMSREGAEAMYEDIAKIYASGEQDALRAFGSMGETLTIREAEHAGRFQVEGSRTYNMRDVGRVEGETIGENTVLGFGANKEPVLPDAPGVISEIAKTDTGFAVTMRHSLGMAGAKTETAGVKGLGDVSEHFATMRNIVNKLHQRLGTGGIIPEDVNVLAPAEYAMDKFEPSQVYMGLAEDVLNRLEPGALPGIEESLLKLANRGITLSNGELMIDATKNVIGNDVLGAKDYLATSQIFEELFAQVGAQLRSAGTSKDPIFNAFLQSGSSNLSEWMRMNHLSLTTYVWHHAAIDVPKFTTFTHEMETYLQMGGQTKALEAIQARLQTVSGGNPFQSLEFGEHLFGGKLAGEVVPASEAFLSSASLSSAEGRAGSIFDPSIEKYKQNFQMRLANGRTVPVPGTAAYGAESSEYASKVNPNQPSYQTHPWQHTLREMKYEKDADKLGKLEARLYSEYKESFLTGKHSAFRPHQFDPMGASGVLGIAAEQGDPFLSRISPEIVESIRSQRVREALMRGEEVVGVLGRQPTNYLPFFRFKMDPLLKGRRTMSISERISRLVFGDVDRDPIDAMFFDATLQMQNGKLAVASAADAKERAAAEQALEFMQGGRQAKTMEAMESVLGAEEIASLNKSWAPKSLLEQVQKFAGSVADRARIAVNRSAGAAIGGYSTPLTEITEHMARSPFVANDFEAAARLNAVTFSMIRQVPISARKAKATFSLETAMHKLNQLHSAMANENTKASASQMMDYFMSTGRAVYGDEWTSKQQYRYLSSEKAMADLEGWAATRTEKARLAKQAMTTSVDLGRPFEEQFAAKNLPNIMEDTAGMLGHHRGGRMAEETATKMGKLSEMLAEKGRAVAEVATGKLGATFAKHGKSMAIGLGAMAALGVAMTARRTPVATFNLQSSNAYRPEDRIGVSDGIPGEPVSGEMAPSNPPRRQMMGAGGVRKMMVAPMRQTSDLSVRMRATDHTRAAETARQIAMIPGSGDTNVTINYRDRTKLGSLRTREKIREINA